MANPPQHFDVGPAEAGQRLDRVLMARFPGAGRAGVLSLIGDGQVRVGGRPAAKGRLLSEGERVVLGRPPAAPIALPDPAAAARVTVAHADARLVVVDKAAGMPTHPLRGDEPGSLAGALLSLYPEMAGVGYGPREPGLLHRLDTDTSGLVIAARDAATFAALRADLRCGKIEKHYLARCAGAAPGAGELRAHLRARGPTVRVFDTARDDTRPVSLQVLRAEPCADGDGCRVWVSVCFAARHQVRAQLAHVGLPLLGDVAYGGPLRSDGGEGHLLHACFVGLSHPESGERLEVCSEAPEAFWG